LIFPDLLSAYLQDDRITRILSTPVTSGGDDGDGSGSRRFRLYLKGLYGSSRAFILSAVFRKKKGVHLVVIPEREAAAYFFNDLENILGEQEKDADARSVLFFPSSFKREILTGTRDNHGLLARTEVLKRLGDRPKGLIIVTYPDAIAELALNRKQLEKNTLRLSEGEKVNMDFVLDLLVEYEFERTDFVIEPGQFSLRGGLIDVYSFSSDHPYRIEFRGDQISSVRTFDPASQLSIEKKAAITIVPDTRINQERKQHFDPIFGFLPPGATIWLEDTAVVSDLMDKLPGSDLLLKGSDLLRHLLGFSTLEWGGQPFFKTVTTIQFNTVSQPSFNKNFELLFDDLQKHLDQGYKVFLLADNSKQAERIQNILSSSSHPLFSNETNQLHAGLTVPACSLHEGFIDRDLKVVCYTDHQIFERYHKYHLADGYSGKEALTLKELYNLQPGDFVTHIDHGVGRFDGLEKIINNGREQEAIRLIYKNDDLLYVSIHSLHRITRYAGKEGSAPVLNRLGSDTWNRLKTKTKSRVKDIARELIKLYAERRAVKGHACMPDTYLQTELEASFIYEDTPDQIRSTLDVKKDLEQPFPMDRLICGDVGFGKTEIAVRAAFKVVTESRQVAVLVPTTILALQHYKTFSERLRNFPCRVNYISRFKSAQAQKKILAETEEGKIDILIGTHRILSKDVRFRNLGLLIIDEEQKFGVAAKEKIRQFRVNVDTLTLTATPIPRTLQFSLMGARDLSVINTPPANRFPVQTEIHPFNEQVIREAIVAEISRGGQIFFVTTRVQNITEIAGMVQRTVPRSRVAVAHGQMEGHKLEQVMVDFIEGEYDVLVATTIIESGLDIPNVNTIIINDAHHYGLSDLHQLRGRVGRSNKKAFCILLAPPPSALTDEARKRLRAIEEFSELGSGFNIAMRDLDIRGAGNILGAEQSGFISEIGYEMYQKILDEALQELKETDFKDLFVQDEQRRYVRDCVIETDLELLIPDYYVTNIAERLSLYKELDSTPDEESLQRFTRQMEDRFGLVPEPTLALINTLRLRWVAQKTGFERLVLRNNRLTAQFPAGADSTYFQTEQFARILDYLRDHPRSCTMKQDGDKLYLNFREVNSVEEARITIGNLLL